MIAASEARGILLRQYQALFGATLPEKALRLLLAQSLGEGRWGELSGYDAAGNFWGNNRGAVQSKHGPPCPYGTFQHGDSRPTSNGQVPFQWCFQGYLTNDDGARDFLRHALVYRKAAHRALLTGDRSAYARALYGDGTAPYFGGFGTSKEARIQSYIDFLATNGKTVEAQLGPVRDDAGTDIEYQAPFGRRGTSKATLIAVVTGALVGAAILIKR